MYQITMTDGMVHHSARIVGASNGDGGMRLLVSRPHGPWSWINADDILAMVREESAVSCDPIGASGGVLAAR